MATAKKPAAKKAAKKAVKKPAAKKAVKKVVKKVAAKKAVKKVVKKVAAKKPAAKKAVKKVAVKKVAAKKVAKKATKVKSTRKPNAAFMKPLNVSAVLAEVVGSNPLPRTEVTKKVWDYIKKHKLQDSVNRRNINADDKLKAVFGGKKTVSMFEMTKLISAHLK
ncbi:MAG: SWIB/MDM2 domain-containing protein [Burkholderiales bacterium]|jgi:chromatin remodeling complex protein RSC6|nr:SWIB/MDM2 domain-containing protein [Burkholderiales bacterium]